MLEVINSKVLKLKWYETIARSLGIVRLYVNISSIPMRDLEEPSSRNSL
jgi:hypothetical protein